MSVDVKVLGRLAGDPEERHTPNAVFATFDFATNIAAKDDKGNHKTLFIDVTAWGKLGQTILKHCKKGSQLLITGVIYDNTIFERFNGEKVPRLSVTMEKFEFVGSGSKDNALVPF